ncbi:hypothetical protein [Pelosinus fermentans]|nr:hypothetical protein [Pelosinus fermentans]
MAVKAFVIVVVVAICGLPHIAFGIAYRQMEKINDQVNELRRKYRIPREGSCQVPDDEGECTGCGGCHSKGVL